MKRLITVVAALILAPAADLSSDYSQRRRLRIEMVRTVEVETTEFRMERDGTPMMDSRGGGSSEIKHHIVQIDDFLDHESDDGIRPTHVQREYELVEGHVRSERGGVTDEQSIDSPFDGVTLELKLDEAGDLIVEAVEGGSPDPELLEGHALALALDAFLPAEEVEDEDSWNLDSEAIAHALGLDLQQKLFLPPSPDAAEASIGRRGVPGFHMGAESALMSRIEWEGTARLRPERIDHEGIECAVIELELKSSGDLPEPDYSGASSGFVPPEIEGTYEIELTGEFLFATAERRPVQLEMEGSLQTETEMTFSRGESSTTINTAREGDVKLMITVSEAE